MFQDPKRYAGTLMHMVDHDLDKALECVIIGARDYPESPQEFWRDVARECVILAGVLTPM